VPGDRGEHGADIDRRPERRHHDTREGILFGGVYGAVLACSFKHMEIAVYRALAAAAKTAGENDVVRICETILPQEQAMADWLDQHLPELVEQYLVRAELPSVSAKR